MSGWAVPQPAAQHVRTGHERADCLFVERWRKETTMTTSQSVGGQPLPDITLPLLSGGELSLLDLRGKKQLLFMWGSW